jgi:cilia- and flagella-associated protein 43
MLYDQFDLYTDDQKYTQIVLLNDLIYKIKESFNKEFENAFQRKLQELAKIRERNTRIKQINADLDDTSPIWEPDLTEKENPSLLFEVKDSEVRSIVDGECLSSRLLFAGNRFTWNDISRPNN